MVSRRLPCPYTQACGIGCQTDAKLTSAQGLFRTLSLRQTDPVCKGACDRPSGTATGATHKIAAALPPGSPRPPLRASAGLRQSLAGPAAINFLNYSHAPRVEIHAGA